MADLPPDRIHIRDLALRCIIGVYPAERRDKQDVSIDITLAVDCRPAGASDALADTVDYKAIKKRVVAMVEQSQFQLVESLAERIAEICLADDGVHEARVAVSKPAALRFARTVCVEIVRRRESPRA